MNFKRYALQALLFLALAAILTISTKSFVHAQEAESNVHIKAEVSSDNGTTWKNYSGTEYSGGETISVSPGSTVLTRVKIWNSALGWYPSNLSGTGVITNSSYIQSGSVVSDDSDGNANPYTNLFFDGPGTGGIAYVSPNGAEDGANCETMQVSFVLADSFPAGETIITATATISDFTDNLYVVFMKKLFGTAYAAGAGRNSTIRIAVNNNPTPTPSATVSETSTAALPATGAGGGNALGATVAVFILASAIAYGLFRALKKSA